MGAWVETLSEMSFSPVPNVAPYVGAWVETHALLILHLPLFVAPYVGAWVETKVWKMYVVYKLGRTLRGCVG